MQVKQHDLTNPFIIFKVLVCLKPFQDTAISKTLTFLKQGPFFVLLLSYL